MNRKFLAKNSFLFVNIIVFVAESFDLFYFDIQPVNLIKKSLLNDRRFKLFFAKFSPYATIRAALTL